MFLKYPREVRSINSSYIHNNSQISVINRSTSNSLKYVITPYLTKSDIAHKTEIYTSFARFKILIMNNKLYLICEKVKFNSFTSKEDNKFYDHTQCIFISNCLDYELQNLLSVLCVINKFKEEFYQQHI